MSLQRILALLVLLLAQPALAQTSHDIDQATVEKWLTDLSNWRRWGQDDVLGALNLVTPERRREALKLASEGATVSLARNYTRDPNNDERSSFRHQMFGVAQDGPFLSDRYSFTYHGPAHSHLDALCHVSYKGKMFNGVPKSTATEQGCASLSILDLKQGITIRGVLIDVPRLKKVEYLQPGTPIYVEDIEAWERQSGIKVRAGDLLLLRTGRWAGNQDRATPRSGAGFHASVAPWLKQRDIALIGSDYATDVAPSGIENVSLPLHQLLIAAMGVRILDNLDLEALAQEAAKRKRWEFLVTMAPLPIVGGTGSPINPIATF
jgi:kynurenine formamidase